MKITVELTKEKVLAAQRVLFDNGIDADDTAVVIEALGAVLFDKDIDELIEYDEDNVSYDRDNESIWGKRFDTITLCGFFYATPLTQGFIQNLRDIKDIRYIDSICDDIRKRDLAEMLDTSEIDGSEELYEYLENDIVSDEKYNDIVEKIISLIKSDTKIPVILDPYYDDDNEFRGYDYTIKVPLTIKNIW